MSIDSSEMEIEKEHLKDTLKWLESEIKNIQQNDKKLKMSIEDLRKQSRGKYNEELDTKEKLYNITHKSLEKYEESKEKPYFGRIDFREYKSEKETFYIGKFGLGDVENGDEKVIDWRAPLADLYYSGVEGDTFYKSPVGVISGKLSLKRKFLIENGNLKDAFDDGVNEILLKSDNEEGNPLVDEFLKVNLNQSVNNRLKDVVATIQKEQNDIIRAEKNTTLIFQGTAGSGKTTVALHRLAYLLYRYKDKLGGKDVLVIAPNKLFLSYISDVLPDLGVDNVKQMTFEELCSKILHIKCKIYTKDKKLADILENKQCFSKKNMIYNSRIRGSILYRKLIDDYIKYIGEKDLDISDIKVDDYILFDSREIYRLYTKDMKYLPENQKKYKIKKYFELKIDDKIHKIMDKIDFLYDYKIARLKKTMKDSAGRRNKIRFIYDERDEKKEYIIIQSEKNFEDYFNRWTEVDTSKLYEKFLTDKDVFEKIISKKVSRNRWNDLVNEIQANKQNNVIDSDDLAALCYLKFKIDGIPEKFRFKYLVVDEAQDYSSFEMTVLKEISTGSSMTIVGDLAQGIYDYRSISDWNDIIQDIFGVNTRYFQLTQSYRSTVEIIEFANKILELQKSNLIPAVPVLRHGDSPKILKFINNRDFSKSLDKIVKKVHDSNKRTIAIIGKTSVQCKKIRDYLKKYSAYNWNLVKENDNVLKEDKMIIPSYMTKGLEFDCTIIYNCNEENYTENELDKKILYVALTRALHMEYIFYSGKISKIIESFYK
ncbi:AAA family ATPase [Clostridium sp. WLY-B-L2]|uniref:AAA family ATPase n=1 Tax=Clostridium aromativorans TaxID=2836848 RepID=A0ABS8N6L1_9CLOT|nr:MULTISPECIES: RNA polymerase recycling motor HelD [Clostridium]KAA8670223.1 AAA family ATPase [Clostridium sp. HV4-5-A1G]MCC9295444.1 AAA family ATPase [Clostridium aromativorans]